MKYKKKLLLVLMLFVCGIALNAAPALPTVQKISQPDGSIIRVILKGDEYANFLETVDGYVLKQSFDGYYRYVYLDDDSLKVSEVVVHDINQRTTPEIEFLNLIDRKNVKGKIISLANKRKNIRENSPGVINKVFPTTGDVKGLVVLAEFKDVRFSSEANASLYNDFMNKKDYDGPYASGSVYDYFYDQSHGQLRLDFDVVGPVTLPENRAFYGSAKETGSENVSAMIIDAVRLAKEMQPELDFSGYDKNNDGEVDFIYVIYAGHGEAQGGPEESVWPQASSLQYISWDLYDGLYLGSYACSCELNGKAGEILDGIGTFCHEFGHILGLPDLYDTGYSGFNGMGYWDVMDVGSYNNKSKTPAGYSAFEKYSLGWIDPKCLKHEPDNLDLQPGESVFLISEHDKNEYFLFENRQPDRWDVELPGHGMLVSRIKYDRVLWNSNRVNTSSSGFEHVKLIAANNNPGLNDSGNLFPGSMNKTSFTDYSNPSMSWNSGARVGKPLTDIFLSEQGVLSFAFMGGKESLTDNLIYSDLKVCQNGEQICIENAGKMNIALYTLNGIQIYSSSEELINIGLKKGVYLIKTRNGAQKLMVK